MLRFEEEVELLLEEMRRVEVYGRWKAAWWRERATALPNASEAVREGLKAYAERAAKREEAIVTKAVERWAPLISTARELVAGLPVSSVIEINIEEEELEEGNMEDDIE